MKTVLLMCLCLCMLVLKAQQVYIKLKHIGETGKLNTHTMYNIAK